MEMYEKLHGENLKLYDENEQLRVALTEIAEVAERNTIANYASRRLTSAVPSVWRPRSSGCVPTLKSSVVSRTIANDCAPRSSGCGQKMSASAPKAIARSVDTITVQNAAGRNERHQIWRNEIMIDPRKALIMLGTTVFAPLKAGVPPLYLSTGG